MRIVIDNESNISQEDIGHRIWATDFLTMWFQGANQMNKLRQEIINSMVETNPGVGDETLTYYNLKGKLQMLDNFPHVIAEQYGLKIVEDDAEA